MPTDHVEKSNYYPPQKELTETEFYCAINGIEIKKGSESNPNGVWVHGAHANVLVGNLALSFAHFPSAKKELDAPKQAEIKIIADQLSFYLNQGYQVGFLADTNTKNSDPDIVMTVIDEFAKHGLFVAVDGVTLEDMRTEKTRALDPRFNQQSHIPSKTGSTKSQTMLGLRFSSEQQDDACIREEVLKKQQAVRDAIFSPLEQTLPGKRLGNVFDHGVIKYDTEYDNGMGCVVPAQIIKINFSNLRATDIDAQFKSANAVPSEEEYGAYVAQSKQFMEKFQAELAAIAGDDEGSRAMRRHSCNEYLDKIWNTTSCRMIRGYLKDEQCAYNKIQKDLYKYFSTQEKCVTYNETLDKHETIIKSLASLQAYGGFVFPGLDKPGMTFEKVMCQITSKQIAYVLNLEEAAIAEGRVPILLASEADAPGFRQILNATRTDRIRARQDGIEAVQLDNLSIPVTPPHRNSLQSDEEVSMVPRC